MCIYLFDTISLYTCLFTYKGYVLILSQHSHTQCASLRGYSAGSPSHPRRRSQKSSGKKALKHSGKSAKETSLIKVNVAFDNTHRTQLRSQNRPRPEAPRSGAVVRSLPYSQLRPFHQFIPQQLSHRINCNICSAVADLRCSSARIRCN